MGDLLAHEYASGQEFPGLRNARTQWHIASWYIQLLGWAEGCVTREGKAPRFMTLVPAFVAGQTRDTLDGTCDN